ncbi:SidA/IucD/PvdA family monooxygenase [Aestuariivirga sp.]|uniref:SidA/IucD/PvdA family monooxygenase n=1 Tax=Aestuariivirga sp. TaxID=2650926 RepID=UPI003BAB63E6
MVAIAPTISEPADVVCVGAGPANLSFASLAQKRTGLDVHVIEKSSSISWHPYALYDESNLQTSLLEDLVTPVDPSHDSSFLCFLAAKQRMTQFLCASDPVVTRVEFQQYLQWAAERVQNLALGESVERVTRKSDLFKIETTARTLYARNISLGVGVEPFVPAWASHSPSAQVMHAWTLSETKPDVTGATVAVVGGGQTSAEVVDTLLNGTYGKLARIIWICRRSNLFPMDDTPFVNEFFSPQYARYFNTLTLEARSRIANANRLLCDGISSGMAASLYNKIYAAQHVAETPTTVSIALDQDVTALEVHGRPHTLILQSNADGLITPISADAVILATGCTRPFPHFLKELSGLFQYDEGDEFKLDQHYRVLWNIETQQQIYAHNRGRRTHGLGDNTFCMVSWRSAIMLNDILKREVFAAAPPPTAIDWMFGR